MIYRESLIKVTLLILCSFLYSELQCNYCNQSIKGTYFKIESKVYHEKCYKDNITPKCGVCKKPLDKKYVTSDGGAYHSFCYT